MNTWTVGAGANFATIQAAINSAQVVAGDTIQVLAGTYTENVSITKGVTLTGANAGVAGYGTRVAESSLIGTFQVRTDGVTIDGFRITGGTNAVTGQATNPYDNLTITNNLITGTDSAPIQFGFGTGGGIGSDNWEISNNLIEAINGNDRTGMVLFNVNGLTVEDNVINHDVATSLGRRGMNLDGNSNATVTGNTINLGLVAPTDAAEAVTAANNGIQIAASNDFQAITNVTVSGNTISGAATGIVVRSGRDMTDVVIDGNTIDNVVDGVVLGTPNLPSANQTVEVAVTGNTITAGRHAVDARDLHDNTVPGPTTFTNLDITGNTVLQGTV